MVLCRMQSLVSILLVSSVGAEVVANFEECRQYFYQSHVPQWPAASNHIHICQMYKNSSYYATLYDTSNRIPIYSAYIVEESETISEPGWMVEPQLVDQNYENSMMDIGSVMFKHDKLQPGAIGQRQALNEDYRNRTKGYNRGHLNPNSHHKGEAAKATYTLTNIVPQGVGLNKGKWKEHEDKLQKLSTNNQVFVLVGAISSLENWIENSRVNIPDYLWVAYCYCDKDSGSCKSGGATAKNRENKLYECSLTELEEFLKNHVQLFHEDCYEKRSAGASATVKNPCNIK